MPDPSDDEYFDDLWGIPKHAASKLTVGCLVVAIIFGVALCLVEYLDR